MMSRVLASSLMLSAVLATGCAADRAAERQIEALVERPSVSRSGLSTDITRVTFVYTCGMNPRGASYRLQLSADDTFVWDGFGTTRLVGVHRGPFEFSPLAAWIESQHLPIGFTVSDGGAVDAPTVEVRIERRSGPAIDLSSGTPIEDVQVWGIVRVLQGIAREIEREHRDA